MTREQIKRLAKVSGEYLTINECMNDIVIFVNDVYGFEIPHAFPKLIKILNDTCVSKDEELDEYHFDGFDVDIFYLSTDI